MAKTGVNSGSRGKKGLKRKAAAEEPQEAAVAEDGATESGVQPPKAAAFPPGFSISEIKNKQRRHLMFTRWKQQQRKVGRGGGGRAHAPHYSRARVMVGRGIALTWSRLPGVREEVIWRSEAEVFVSWSPRTALETFSRFQLFVWASRILFLFSPSRFSLWEWNQDVALS